LLTVLLPVTRAWSREAVCAAIAASDIPRGRVILVLDAPGCEAWSEALASLGFAVSLFETGNPDPPTDRLRRRVRHAAMRDLTLRLIPDGELLILDDDTLVPVDVYARLSAAGPHATGIQVSRWGNDLCGVYRGDRPLREGMGVEAIDYCGHYCLLTTGAMYRATAVHGPSECYMQPIPGLVADWGCVCGHLTDRGVLYPKGVRP
jgi:hypothetical protein